MIHQLVLGKYHFGTAFAYGLEQAGLPVFLADRSNSPK